ncbi:23S rRNA (uracil(1939)-C(5))-methyltransferase RlmD [Gallaecimonas mangrovi]|uniref:23S rRNA (uracil(1939)-C(5))-methyltransferase RlmD n=1 Tax=Gallaecimonas mangrovi TaxID=2291597 RepID=UPI000E2006FC|nr:23S rRNA (uracil(1939)-C(5))-methyltransferase RlmD [Gallaecimonas mangrovi]
MVQIYRTKKRQQKSVIQEVTINSLDLHGQGVGRSNGLVCFVPGALPGERVTARLTAKGKVASGRLQAVIEASPERINPQCNYAGSCGGCQLQHLSADKQLQYKEAALREELIRAGMQVAHWAPPLKGPAFHYRRTMRLAIYQGKLGLRAVGSQNIIPIEHCQVAQTPLSALLPSLQQLLATLKGHKLLGHLELMHLPPHTAALWRLTGPLPKADQAKLVAWAKAQHVALYSQEENIDQLWPEAPLALGYALDGLNMTVGPADFIQVNADINNAMVAQAMDWLAPQAGETVLDAYSGLGNFSLPLAKRAKQVVAVEGVAAMTERCRQNAVANGLNNIVPRTMNLDDAADVSALVKADFDAVLLDPARPGAQTLCQALADGAGPQRVLYVSCNPSTWKRDAQLLMQGGYQINKLGLMDMFSQTAHVELMALFIREG